MAASVPEGGCVPEPGCASESLQTRTLELSSGLHAAEAVRLACAAVAAYARPGVARPCQCPGMGADAKRPQVARTVARSRGRLPAMRVSVAAASWQFDYAVAHVQVDSPRSSYESEDPRVVVPFGADDRCGCVRRRDTVDVTARRPAGHSTVAGQWRLAVLRCGPA